MTSNAETRFTWAEWQRRQVVAECAEGSHVPDKVVIYGAGRLGRAYCKCGQYVWRPERVSDA